MSALARWAPIVVAVLVALALMLVVCMGAGCSTSPIEIDRAPVSGFDCSSDSPVDPCVIESTP